MIRINLLPVREERRKQDLQQFVALMAAVLIGSVALASVFHWSLRSDLSETKTAIKQTEQQIERFGPQLEKVQEYKKTKAQIEQKLAVIEELEESRSGPVHMLDELAIHAPDRLWITKLQASGRTVQISGLSLDNELVATFMTALESSAYFKGVELQSTEAKTINGFKLNAFDVSAAVTSPGAESREKAAEGAQTAWNAATPGGAGR